MMRLALRVVVVAVALLPVGPLASAEFDCLDISDLQVSPPDCPDPSGAEPWCTCVETFFSTLDPGANPTITQELIYSKEQPTAGDYFLDVDGGTLDLSGVKEGDEVMRFVVEAEVGQPLPFVLDFAGVVTAVRADAVDFDIVLGEVNAVTLAVLDYCDGACSPTDEQHSNGKLYEGTLRSRGAGLGFTLEYYLFEPEAGMSRALEDGDLDAPNFSIPALMTIMDGSKKLYTNPSCGGINATTVLMPKVQSLMWTVEVVEKQVDATFQFGACAASFRRADADANGTVEITDAIFSLNHLFTGGPAPKCPDAADADDNGAFEITDPIRTLGFLFLGGDAPPPPGPLTCGPDVGDDSLDPCVYDC